MRWRQALSLLLVSCFAVGACGGSSKHARPAAPTPTAASSAPAAEPPTYPRLTRRAFGMHWLDYRSPAMPRLSFGSVRLMGGNVVTWPVLQPTSSSRLDAANPAVRQLDAMIALYRRRGAEPLIVLGPTPAWAAERCPHDSWPVETCAPASRGLSSPWARYVRFLAGRYRGVTFEMWNEPNLRNGYNDTVEHLAELQATTHSVLKQANPAAVLVSPTVGVTAGDPISWLTQFLAAPGGKDFDVFGLHLYSSDASSRAGNGPEWSLDMFHQVTAALQSAGLTQPVWDTEVNVGRYDFRNTTSRVFIGLDGAAMVTRTYALQLGSGVRRVYWYAGDDRSWSGTWLVNSDGSTLTQAGQAINVVRRQLLGTTPRGCTSDAGGRWVCRFARPSGGSVQVLWTTGATTACSFAVKNAQVLDALGRPLGATGSGPLRLSAVPVYVVGAFPIAATCG